MLNPRCTRVQGDEWCFDITWDRSSVSVLSPENEKKQECFPQNQVAGVTDEKVSSVSFSLFTRILGQRNTENRNTRHFFFLFLATVIIRDGLNPSRRELIIRAHIRSTILLSVRQTKHGAVYAEEVGGRHHGGGSILHFSVSYHHSKQNLQPPHLLLQLKSFLGSKVVVNKQQT